MVPLICGWEYFPKKRGLVTGICLGGYGFGSFIFSQVSSAIVNPGKDKPIDDPTYDINFYAESVALRVPKMIRQLVYMWIGLWLIGLVFVSRPPMIAKDEDEELEQELLLSSQDRSGKRAGKEDDLEDKINKSDSTAPGVATHTNS